MKSTPKIINRFPVLQFINIDNQIIDYEDLSLLQSQIHLNYHTMTKKSKLIWKKVKQISDLHNQNFKRNKKLYKALSKTIMAMGISLNSQSLQSLQAFNKKELKQLRNLQLNDNYISSLDPLLKSNIPQLQSLQIGRNSLKDIKIISQANWTKLKTLILSENLITSIQPLVLTYFEQIQSINLNENNICDISLFGRKNLRNLKQFDIGANQLMSIHRFYQGSFPKLQYINLDQNFILQNQDIEKIDINYPLSQIKISNVLTNKSILQRRRISKFTAYLQMNNFIYKMRLQKIKKKSKFIQFY